MAHVSEERLLLYLDGELPEPEAGPIADHLRGCETCRRVLGEYLEIEQAVAEMPALGLVPVRSSRKPAPRPDWRRVGLVAAALATVLGASWGLQLAGYWQAERVERVALFRDHYALVSTEASLLGEAGEQW